VYPSSGGRARTLGRNSIWASTWLVNELLITKLGCQSRSWFIGQPHQHDDAARAAPVEPANCHSSTCGDVDHGHVGAQPGHVDLVVSMADVGTIAWCFIRLIWLVIRPASVAVTKMSQSRPRRPRWRPGIRP
jgi:hypothetical protein